MTTALSMNETLLRTKEHTDGMLEWLRGRGRAVIVIHDSPDPDCLASAMALSHLFAVRLNREAVITFSGMIGRSENIAMARKLGIKLTPLGMVDLGEFSVVCMLDTQPGTGNNSLPAGSRVDIVIDHHPVRESSRNCRWMDIRDEYGVTATILYEYLVAQKVGIGTKLATALFYAIKSETQDLGREATRPDRDAYLRLFPLANKRLLFEITQPKLPIEHFLTIHRGIENSVRYGKLLVVNLMAICFPEVVAEMADYLLRLEGVETVLCMGHYNAEVILSIRTTNCGLNAGEIIRRMVDGRGKAGGHGMMAGGKLEKVPFDPEVLKEIEEYLTRGLLAELSIEGQAPERLIRV
jgi:nanoRNase/pAp phosphatase (c-di-AMP/oligoRNAs hydrolase)